jgi:hypothetical protein
MTAEIARGVQRVRIQQERRRRVDVVRHGSRHGR